MNHDEKFYDYYTSICKSISTPIRIKIIETIGEEDNLNVSQIQKKLDIPISRLSNNLSILYKIGVLDKQKKGSFIYYFLKHKEIIDAIKNMKKVVELIALEGSNLLKKKEMISDNFYFIFALLFDYPNNKTKEYFEKFIKILNISDNMELSDIDNLELSYTSLFINSYPSVPAPPYSSSYISRPDIYDIVENYYKLGGYIIDTRNQPPDYLIFELIFLSNLYNDNNILLEQKFLEEHFIKWFEKFTSKIINSEEEGFYPYIAEKSLNFIKNRLKELKYGKTDFPS
jgi:ArsR family transcriptional regulator